MSQETRPLAGLPGADRTLLAHPPLELAVAEFRTTLREEELSADSALRFKERLADLGVAFVRMEPIQQQRLSLNVQAGVAASPQVEVGTRGWLFVSADGATQMSLLPEAVVYQTSRYNRWSVTMRPAIEAVVTAMNELQPTPLVMRIGVRYVNRLVDTTASTAQSWIPHLNEHFLGPLCHEDLGVHVRASQQQVELVFSGTQGALVRHGPFLDATAGGSSSYLIDIDVFDTEPLRLDEADLVERIEVLNRTAATLFQAVLKPDYLKYLQSVDVEEQSNTGASA
ncbi:MAG: TIGR04255 family protein [Ferrimicrobium acidiphilum]